MQQGAHLAWMNNVEYNHDDKDRNEIKDIEKSLGARNRSICALNVHDYPEDASSEDQATGNIQDGHVFAPGIRR